MIYIELALMFAPILLVIVRGIDLVNDNVSKGIFVVLSLLVISIVTYSWLCNLNVIVPLIQFEYSILIGANANTVIFTPVIVFIYILSHVEIFESDTKLTREQ